MAANSFVMTELFNSVFNIWCDRCFPELFLYVETAAVNSWNRWDGFTVSFDVKH